jgi:Uncharacterized protein conserved in bacteria (DUF2325)
MCVALVGGMDSLKRRYERTALGYGVDLRHFERSCPRFEQRPSGVDGVIIFTDRVSHDARKRALSFSVVKGRHKKGLLLW